ncbi:MAG: hypothetical protein CML54_00150 [Rhodobacteraceae bacterium]|nr:hypothetical protein [Paracoccaceae bacterium]
MNTRHETTLYDAVLSYCISKTLSGYDQAINYGRLSGFFTADNKLTSRGRDFAETLTSNS